MPRSGWHVEWDLIVQSLPARADAFRCAGQAATVAFDRMAASFAALAGALRGIEGR